MDLMCPIKHSNCHVLLNYVVRKDLLYLSRACEHFNCTVVLLCGSPFPEVVISGDACATGGAAYCNPDWFYVNWMIYFPSFFYMHINLKELFTVLVGLRHQWKNTYLHVYTDNMVTKYKLN